MYRNMQPDTIIETILILRNRIHERFPASALVKVCDELHNVAYESKQRAVQISRPKIGLRIVIFGLIALSLFALLYSISLVDITFGSFGFAELVQITEAGINNVVLIGAAIIFLVTVEVRYKRAHVMDALHELRSIAHVIDMRQLTIDPSRGMLENSMTASSPKLDMTPFQLTRYLDYCSEMLSLTGKVAALYAQYFRDPVVVSAVNEVESLTTGLSRKIWQKIMLMQALQKHMLTP